MTSIVALLSGGMDSTTLVEFYHKQGHTIRCLAVDYGQRHRKELIYARNYCESRGIEFRVADLSKTTYLFAGSSQTSEDIEVPDGHYAEETMKLTVVPNRNMMMLSLATAWAVSTKSELVAYAAHAGDHAIYPDCRPVFVQRMRDAIAVCDWASIGLSAPFIAMSKSEIAQVGYEMKLDYSLTWSCYKGGEKHCGTCGTDVERKEAFRLAGIPDPTEYFDDTGVFRG